MLGRRQVIAGLGALAAGASVAPAWGHPELNLEDPEDRLTALAKLRGSTDERLVIGWVIGSRYAVVEHKATPMYGILATTFSRYRRLSASEFSARTFEVAYFTDLDTGKLIDTWKNPFSGQTIEVPQTRMGPSDIVMSVDGLRVDIPDGEAAGLELNHRFRDPVVHGGDVWITEEINVDGNSAHLGGKPFVYNEMSTYRCRKRDLDDPELASVPMTVDFHGLVTFRPWMGFGDIQGHTTARAAGRRVDSMSELPPYYLELTEQHHPDVFADPLAVLMGDAG